MLSGKSALAAASLFGIVLAAPAFAACGDQDKNGCSASPTTYKACSKDLKGDLKDLACDIKDLLHDISKDPRDVKGDLKDIREDLNEIKFDVAVLSKLSPKK